MHLVTRYCDGLIIRSGHSHRSADGLHQGDALHHYPLKEHRYEHCGSNDCGQAKP